MFQTCSGNVQLVLVKVDHVMRRLPSAFRNKERHVHHRNSNHIRTKRAGHPSKFQELQDPSRKGNEGKGSAPNPENHPASKMWMHFFENRWKETHFGWYHFKLCISNDIFKRLNQAIVDQAAGQCVSLPGWAAGSAIPNEWIIVIPNRSVSIG